MPLVYRCDVCGTEQDMTGSEGIPHCPLCHQPMQRRRIPAGGGPAPVQEVHTEDADAAETVTLERKKFLKPEPAPVPDMPRGGHKTLKMPPPGGGKAQAEPAEPKAEAAGRIPLQTQASAPGPSDTELIIRTVRQEGEKMRRQISEQIALMERSGPRPLDTAMVRMKRLLAVVCSLLLTLYLVAVLWKVEPVPPLIVIPSWVFLVAALTVLCWNVFQLLRKTPGKS